MIDQSDSDLRIPHRKAKRSFGEIIFGGMDKICLQSKKRQCIEIQNYGVILTKKGGERQPDWRRHVMHAEGLNFDAPGPTPMELSLT